MMNSLSSDTQEARPAEWRFCYEILPDVSRTFALTIPVLEGSLTDGVCVAYLLCRIADTIEDRNDLDLGPRQWLYQCFADLVADPPERDAAPTDTKILEFLRRWPRENNPDYQTLVEGLGNVIGAFSTLDVGQRDAINDCVQEMVGGMCSMTHKRPVDGIVYVCRDLAELEQYCHYVAGTVGLMLTKLFDVHMQMSGAFATARRLEQGRRFGLGLQLTNILKDQRSDIERGTSFMPRQWCDGDGRLLKEHRLALVRRTMGYLDEAQEYALAIPPQYEGMRLFCLWALWMAVATQREIVQADCIVPKITREEVTEIIAFTRESVGNDHALRERFAKLQAQVHAALAGSTSAPSAVLA